jgi:hypothetical protein
MKPGGQYFMSSGGQFLMSLDKLKQVFDALRELAAPAEPPKRPIGFVPPEEKKRTQNSRGRKTA